MKQGQSRTCRLSLLLETKMRNYFSFLFSDVNFNFRNINFYQSWVWCLKSCTQIKQSLLYQKRVSIMCTYRILLYIPGRMSLLKDVQQQTTYRFIQLLY